MGHGTRNDDERDYERDYDQRQMGNQNEMAPADREYASAEPSVVSGEMKTTIILIGGPSAIGKDSFVRKLDQEPSFRSRFGICGQCFTMTATKGQDVKSDYFTKLDQVLEKQPDVLVLKWQAFLKRRHIDSLQDKYPGIAFRGLFLKLAPQKHAERMYHKHKDRYGFPDKAAALAKCKSQARGDLARFKRLAVPTWYVDAETYEITEKD